MSYFLFKICGIFIIINNNGVSGIMSTLTQEVKQILADLPFPPTIEQQGCVAAALDLVPFKMTAYAGSGKTSTLTILSKVLGAKNIRGLYLAFNKSIAAEAQTKFDASVKCQTFHSLAYKSVPNWMQIKVNNKRNFPKELAELYRLSGEYLAYSPAHLKEIKLRSDKAHGAIKAKGSNRYCSPQQKIQMINDAVARYCKSSSKDVELCHFQRPDWLDEKAADMLFRNLLTIARQRWKDLIAENNNLNISHDVYVKYWALSEPKIMGYDYAMMDEAQDMDSLMQKLLANQNIPIFYVGDSNQSIYAFRGAINALGSLDMPQQRLTQSFRFGPQIASHANWLLASLGEQMPVVGNCSVDSKVYLKHSPYTPVDAILCRTNKGAFNEFVRQSENNPERKFAFIADVREIKGWIEAAKAIVHQEKTFHPDLSFFESWDDVVEYTELNKSDNGFNYMVSLINHFNMDFDRLLDILDTANISPEHADTVIATAHKSKGLEWNSVMISDDFSMQLMSDKFAGLQSPLQRAKEEVYIENWDLIEFPDAITLYPSDDDCFESRLPIFKTLNANMYHQRYRITDMPDEEVRLLYVAITRAKETLYAQNLTDLFVLLGKLSENLDID